MILATQKPSGVVNEQIRSNTKFRVCLKVQDKSDSMDMLKRPEAAALKDTGRFYLQVGYDEYFAMGQSAWAGAMYKPQETVVHHKDASVQVLDMMGQSVLTLRKKEKAEGTGKSQLTEIVHYLSEVAKRNGLEPKYLWMDPLPEKLDLQEIPMNQVPMDELPIPLGILDDPANQIQKPVYLPLRNMQHMWIVGKAGSGKTTLLHTILQYVMEHYKESEVQFHLIDVAGRGFEMYADTPYCGVVIQEENVEKLRNFEELLQEIISERKKLFAQYGITRYEEACQNREIGELPLILVCIDNAGALKVSKSGETYFYHLADLIKGSTDYGIRYLIFTDHLNELTARIKQELPQRIALQLKDRYEYDDVLGVRNKCLPEQRAGRGMVVQEKDGLALQLCMERPWDTTEQSYQIYRERIEKSKEKGDYRWRKTFPHLDETETYDEVQALELTGKGKAIYYTTDGSEPTTSSTKYTEPIKIGEGKTTVKAISVNKKGIPSLTESKTYKVEFPIADAPAVTPSTGQYNHAQSISVVVPDKYTAYYTTDGSDPDPENNSATQEYTGPIAMPEGSTIFSFVLQNQKGRLSDVTRRNYELNTD